MRARVLAVHVEAVGAAVDLRRAHTHQIEQALLESRLPHLPLEPEHGLQSARGYRRREVDTRCHDVQLSFHFAKTGEGAVIVTAGVTRQSRGIRLSQNGCLVRLDGWRASQTCRRVIGAAGARWASPVGPGHGIQQRHIRATASPPLLDRVPHARQRERGRGRGAGCVAARAAGCERRRSLAAGLPDDDRDAVVHRSPEERRADAYGISRPVAARTDRRAESGAGGAGVIAVDGVPAHARAADADGARGLPVTRSVRDGVLGDRHHHRQERREYAADPGPRRGHGCAILSRGSPRRVRSPRRSSSAFATPARPATCRRCSPCWTSTPN